MSISFHCENADCKQEIEVDDEMAGRRVRCPFCDAANDVPARPADTHFSREDDRDYRRTGRERVTDAPYDQRGHRHDLEGPDPRYHDEDEPGERPTRRGVSTQHTLTMVLGIIMTVVAGLGILGSLGITILGLLVGSVFEGPDSLRNYLLFQGAINGFEGIVTLVCGIMLIRKKAVGTCCALIAAVNGGSSLASMITLLIGLGQGVDALVGVANIPVGAAFALFALVILFKLPVETPEYYRGKTLGTRPGPVTWLFALLLLAGIAAAEVAVARSVDVNEIQKWLEDLPKNMEKKAQKQRK